MPANASDLLKLNDPSLLKTDAFINGEWIAGAGRFNVHDPATGEILTDVANTVSAHALSAIDAANKAWRAWADMPAKGRGAILMKWFRLLHENCDDLARILTAEQGKPLAEARGEVAYGASFVEWFAEEARRVYGETISTTDRNKRYLVLKQAVGVCAAITPWNFPIAMITRKVAPALAAGCAVIVKPAEQTPLSALALAELATRAGLPRGLLNVLTADSENSIRVGKVLCESDTVRHLSFTGSTEVGRILMQQCAPTVKKLALELGGNAPFIVFDDADLSSAVEGAMATKFRNAGQTCVCANRIYVQDGVYDRFVEMLAARAKALKVGNGFAADVNIGPLINDEALEKVDIMVADAVTRGARIVTGGRRMGKRFYEPTVLSGATSQMLCAREEIFGPVAPVFRFRTENEVIEMANGSEFGLAGYFYSRDIGRVFRVSEALECGMVGVNTGMISTTEVPFGGIKQSGMGREGARQGIDEYVQIKYLCLGDVLR